MVSGYDRHPPKPHFRPSGLAGWSFTAGVVVALAVVALIVTLAGQAYAANYPCSGNKGGVSHCQGKTLICNDGSVSASKRSCEAELTGGAGLVGGGSQQMRPATAGDCSCRSGSYCSGPKGGRYCTTDSGSKSYLRN